MGVITFNGVASSQFGIEVATFPSYIVPEKVYEIISIPGRNGDLVVDTGNFKNVPSAYEISVPTGNSFANTINEIAEWLHSASGYARLEDTYTPNYYRMAYFSSQLEVANLFNEAGQATIEFTCKPQRYLKNGETPVTFTQSGTIQNGTGYASLPILNVSTDDTEGTITIGNHSIKVKSGVGGHITINSEIQDAYYGSLNKNAFIELNGGNFPVIDPGTQNVSFTGGIESVEVIPRWWTV